MTDSLSREWLPMAPLLAHKPPVENENGKRGGQNYGGIQGLGGERLARAWHRAEASGRLTRAAADEICVHVLHRHPSEVFGALWWGGDA